MRMPVPAPAAAPRPSCSSPRAESVPPSLAASLAAVLRLPLWPGMRALLPAPPCSVNSVISMRSPVSVARRRPSRRSSPSTSARSASLSAPSVPFQRGAARLPDSVASASSVPATRQPGGASIDQTPRLGSRAVTRPASGASAAHCQPPARCSTRVLGFGADLAGALAVPGQAGAHRVAFGVEAQLGLAQAGRRARACRRPHSWCVRSRVPVPRLVMRVTSAASPACTRMSPLSRVSRARARSASPASMSQSPSNSRSPLTPTSASAAPAAERLGPGHRQALQAALRLQAEGAVGAAAAVAEAQRLPLDAHGAGRRPAQRGGRRPRLPRRGGRHCRRCAAWR